MLQSVRLTDRVIDSFVLWLPWSAQVAAARTTHFDLFNAAGSGKLVVVHSLTPILATDSVVTGLGSHWELNRTTSVGTGGTAKTPVKLNTSAANLPAEITARQKPTGGAVVGALLTGRSYVVDETNFNDPPNMLPSVYGGYPLVLREGEGIGMDQVTSLAVGSIGFELYFSLV